MKGNDHFKANEFPEAKKEYDEAIRRNPKDARLYANRAAALMKVLELPGALKVQELTTSLHIMSRTLGKLKSTNIKRFDLCLCRMPYVMHVSHAHARYQSVTIFELRVSWLG